MSKTKYVITPQGKDYMESVTESTTELIIKVCDDLKAMLLDKNMKYGDSVHQSGPLFDVDPVIGIQSRINDKLRRIQNVGINNDTEDSINDLIGYLVHLKIAMQKKRGVPIF
jgi:hypothetical protein